MCGLKFKYLGIFQGIFSQHSVLQIILMAFAARQLKKFPPNSKTHVIWSKKSNQFPGSPKNKVNFVKSCGSKIFHGISLEIFLQRKYSQKYISKIEQA